MWLFVWILRCGWLVAQVFLPMNQARRTTRIPISRTFAQAVPLILGASIAFAALPIRFEENRGQAPRDAAFISRAPGYTALLTERGAVIRLHDGHSVRIELSGSSRTEPVGEQLMVVKSNYLVGADSAQWRSGINNYERVTYPHVYPGIDLVWHGNGEQLEHDFEVAAGADLRQIKLELRGAALELSPAGDLMAGSLRFHKPRAYQGGREVECRYELSGQKVRFVVVKYDHTQALTIDPVLSFLTTFGGSGSDGISATAVDRAGNVYVVGSTDSLDFPVTSDALQAANPGGHCMSEVTVPCAHIFISKFSSDRGTLLYSTYLGSATGGDSAGAIAVGPTGNLYFAGLTCCADFPKLAPLPGQPLIDTDFVAELSADGSSLIYATSLPGVRVTALAVDAASAVYLTGTINQYSTNDLPTVNAFQSKPNLNLVFKTTDGGLLWQGLSNGLPKGGVQTIAIDPTNPLTIYAGTRGAGLYKTFDGGVNWVPMGNGLVSSAAVQSIVVDPRSPQSLYLTAGPIYKSSDGGANWAVTGQPALAPGFNSVSNLVMDPSNSSVLYATAYAGLFKSTDRAVTWRATGLANLQTSQNR
jgi:hypothetical protein